MTSSVSPSPLVVGAPAVYTVTVRNTGTGAATSVTSTISLAPDGAVTIGSPLPAGCTSSAQVVTCTAATIPAGGTVTYDIPVTLSPSLGDGTNISLQGLVSSADAPSTGTQLIVPAFTKADVEIVKTGPATVAPDGTITYTITVTNHGPSNAQSVTWHDPTDGNLTTIVSHPCGNTGLTVTCNLGTLAPGETRTFTLMLTVNPGVPEGTVITNCAVVYTGSPDTNTDNNQSCTSTTVGSGGATGPNLGIVKTATPTVEVGGTIDYSVTITNHGPGAATDVVVSDPIHVPFDSISPLPAGCSLQGITITCTTPTLAVGESKTYDFSVTINAGVPAGTHIMNCATVTSDNSHASGSAHLDCVQTRVIEVPKAEVEIVKTGPAKTRPGETYSYTLTRDQRGPRRRGRRGGHRPDRYVTGPGRHGIRRLPAARRHGDLRRRHPGGRGDEDLHDHGQGQRCRRPGRGDPQLRHRRQFHRQPGPRRHQLMRGHLHRPARPRGPGRGEEVGTGDGTRGRHDHVFAERDQPRP